MAKNTGLDDLDLRILQIIQNDSQKTLKEISEQVNLSLSPTHDRIKRMESDGYIQGYVALLNRKKLNLGLLVHCQVTLEKQNRKNFREFEEAILAFPEVTSCHLVSGNFDYYLNNVA